MIAPPRVATWLLESALSTADREAIVGDLCEEYRAYILPSRGALGARWWYRWQVARSLAPLFFRSWERASLRRASMAIVSAAFLATVPASSMILLRTFVLQQVPLKTTSEMSPTFGLLLLSVVLLTGAVGFAAAIRVLNADPRER